MTRVHKQSPLRAHVLTVSEKSMIVDAVRSVEATTAGEVVVFVSPSSGPYPATRWRAWVLYFFALFLLILVVRDLGNDWVSQLLGHDLSAVGLSALLALVLAVLGDRIDAVRRVFITASEYRYHVDQNASGHFISEEVFATTHRTGILIFVSEFEKAFDIVADVGVSNKVAETAWIEIVNRMSETCRRDGLANAIVEGVNACGTILSSQLPSVDPDNQLSDEVRTAEGSNE